jgi:hypothetical protein
LAGITGATTASDHYLHLDSFNKWVTQHWLQCWQSSEAKDTHFSFYYDNRYC